ncbi:carbohydrate ABC transporter permease [Paenibacillus xanthanilyticus]|uniref:Carbohydrate ABC transporter permease n=1 Tax=Paenibacillus xanthanilyticus TaxID=1783531 RepID=A0ABV8JZ63_9BACL
MTHAPSGRLGNWIINGFFAVVCLLIALPFALVVIISVTSENSLIEHGYQFLPSQLSLEAYQIVLSKPQSLLQGYGVTIAVTVIGTVFSLLLTAMTAYPISRSDFRYNRPITFYIFFTILFSGGMVPFYILMTQYLHLKNTLAALILPSMLSPFNVMIMKGFLDKISKEIIESAKVDGSSELRIFIRIILPLSTPALATLGLFISFGYWNEWFNALLFIDNDKYIPLQLLLVRTLAQIEFLANSPMAEAADRLQYANFPSLSVRMAMAILAGGPMLVIFPFFQKYFVKGLTVGSLKG